MTVVLSIDAMGGDSAPQIVIDGAIKALCDGLRATFIVHGDQSRVLPLLDSHPSHQHLFKIIHTTEVISNDMKASGAIRGLRSSSMRLSIECVLKGEAAAVISAGNTAAYMALSKLLFKTVQGIHRPAIATFLPTFSGRCLAMDLGANIDCTEENLVQFAVMGHVFGQRLLGKVNPSIGLLNVGSESVKGSHTVQGAAQTLRNMPHLNFYGFIEGNDIAAGTTDVVITDGFTGNVALKTIEGTARLIQKMLSDSLGSSIRGKAGYLIAKPAFQCLKDRMDPRLYNGALFLGLQGIAVKSHGGTDSTGFANAIKVAAALGADASSGKILADMAKLLAYGSHGDNGAGEKA
jgi:glycerol-3-phosphate acyltransferase PlsX